MRPTLIVMVKSPRAGRVKTRLGRQIGLTAAAWWYRHHVACLLRTVRDPRWRLVSAVAPDRAQASPHVTDATWPQGAGDLGLRMLRALRRAGSPAVLIGSDVFGITRGHIARAFATLGDHDAVLGPSPDGGFWLIGLKHPRRLHPHALDGARWSTPHAMADTLDRLPGRVALTDTLNDIDTADDLAMTRPHPRAT